jgi:hypothetical protein
MVGPLARWQQLKPDSDVPVERELVPFGVVIVNLLSAVIESNLGRTYAPGGHVVDPSEGSPRQQFPGHRSGSLEDRKARRSATLRMICQTILVD